MTLRQYLTMMSAGTAAAWAAIAVIVTQVDPADAPAPVVVILYLAFLVALTGTFAVLGFLARIFVLRKTFRLSHQVMVSFRQAALLAVVAVLALFLESRALLNWWNGMLLALMVTAAEFFFISATSRSARSPSRARPVDRDMDLH